MTTLTVELPETETKFFKQFLKRINGKVISAQKKPNKETVAAMNELKAGKGVRFKNVNEFLERV